MKGKQKEVINMIHGITVNVGEIVKRTAFDSWTNDFEHHKEYKITEVSEMNKDGWFDIKVEGMNDWSCCTKFSLINYGN